MVPEPAGLRPTGPSNTLGRAAAAVCKQEYLALGSQDGDLKCLPEGQFISVG